MARLTILESFFALLSDPEDALETLIPARHRLYGLVAIVVLAVEIFAPIFYFFARYDFLQTNLIGIVGLAAILFFTTLLFWLIEPIFLRLFGEEITVGQVAEAYGYALSPLIPLILLYYGASFIFLGRLSGVLFIITGVRDAYDWLLPALPILHVVGKLLFLNIFCRALRLMLSTTMINSIFLGVISALPFYLCLIVVTSAAGYLHPNVADIIWRFLHLFGTAWS